MLLEREDVQHGMWERIRTAAAASPDAMTLLVLVALDVDALSSCAMLMVRQRLLRLALPFPNRRGARRTIRLKPP